ncbi:hypothetical protein PC117_g11559 [Phytophthora cactorum]|uniref:Uncharacterized protein n=1 Tax=Phytophthora cactorum TaxID=29920 RepID=A0A8T1DAE7_9STRA|nr:hypothetical protein PC117_g11559 [Phytophthora cactorum]
MGSSGAISLRQAGNGLHWYLAASTPPHGVSETDIELLTECGQMTNLVFNAYPSIHRFPWIVDAGTSNTHVVQSLKREPSGTIKCSWDKR